MQPYDIFMLVVLVGAAGWGFHKGMAWQIASLASLVASYFFAYHFADALAPYLSAQAPWNKFLAMLVLYLGSSFVVWSVFRYVSGAIERVKLREFDRQVGGLFGLAKGVAVCVVITFFAVTVTDQSRQQVLQSRSGYYVAVFLHEATPIMPAEMRHVLGPYLEQLDRGLDPSSTVNHPTLPAVALPPGLGPFSPPPQTPYGSIPTSPQMLRNPYLDTPPQYGSGGR